MEMHNSVKSVRALYNRMTVRSPEPHIVVETVSYRYPRSTAETLAGIEMTISRGEIAAILGSSGSGKSTLLQLLAGFARPTRGRVLVGGETVARPSPSCTLMFQEPALYPWMTALENVGLGLRFAGHPKADERFRAREMLRLVQLEEMSGTNVRHLSGGQQQRVALARALAPEPEVLLLDEPFSSLDPFTRSTLQRDVRAILRRLNITAVVVTHDIDEALVLADQVFVMTAAPGRIAGSVFVPLGDVRDPADSTYRKVRQALVQLFERAAGKRFEEAGEAAAHATRAALSA